MNDVKSTERKRRNDRYASGDYPCLREKLGLPARPPGADVTTVPSGKGKSRFSRR